MLRSVKEMEGYAVGHVKDFYLDDEAWIIRYLVVATGGWLSNRKVLVSPIAVGTPNREQRLLPASISQEQQLRQNRVDRAGRNHQPDRARRGHLRDQFRERRRADGAFGLDAGHRFCLPRINHAGVPCFEEAPHHARAHSTQTDHCNLHFLFSGFRR
jgi:hypothetical protein